MRVGHTGRVGRLGGSKRAAGAGGRALVHHTSFVGTDDAALNLATPIVGSAWVMETGTWVTNNLAGNTDDYGLSMTVNGGGGESKCTVDAGAANCNILCEGGKASVAANSSYVPSIIARYVDASNFWLVYWLYQTNVIHMDSVTAGGWTTEDSASLTETDGAAAHDTTLDITDDVLTATFTGNGASGEELQVTSTKHNSATKVGIYQYIARATQASADVFKVWA